MGWKPVHCDRPKGITGGKSSFWKVNVFVFTENGFMADDHIPKTHHHWHKSRPGANCATYVIISDKPSIQIFYEDGTADSS
jgi:hypothetical protein